MSGASISTPLPLPRRLPVLELVIIALELMVPSALVTVVEIVETVELSGVIVPLIWRGKGAVSPSEVRLQLVCSTRKLGGLTTYRAPKVTLSERTLVAPAVAKAPGLTMSRSCDGRPEPPDRGFHIPSFANGQHAGWSRPHSSAVRP
jgi:hypothetical protein